MTHARSGATGKAPFHIDRKLLATGLVAGAVVGAWAGTKMRGMTTPEQDAGMIDWEQARMVAINMNRGNTLTAAERERLTAYYQEMVDRCVPIVAAYVGTDLPNKFDQTFAFDRVDWINANLEAFKVMFSPIEALNPANGHGKSMAAALWGSVKLAAAKAGDRSQGSVLASDAFFPFPDGLEAAIAAGVTAAVQPGGSVRDAEVIAAANRAGIAMIFTGTRHFLH